jgi:hypothetical protein
MKQEPSMMKGLFNDLTRTLLSSAIFLDDLHLNLQPDSDVYDAWWLANKQLKRAIEFFLELRSTCFWYLSSVDLKSTGNADGHFSKLQGPTHFPDISQVNSGAGHFDGKCRSSAVINSKKVVV